MEYWYLYWKSNVQYQFLDNVEFIETMSSVLSQEWSNFFDPICDTQVKSLCPSRMVEQLANKLWSLFVIHMNNKVIILKLICDNNCYSRVILAGAEPNGLRGVPRNPGPNKILVLTMKTSPYRHPPKPMFVYLISRARG